MMQQIFLHDVSADEDSLADLYEHDEAPPTDRTFEPEYRLKLKYIGRNVTFFPKLEFHYDVNELVARHVNNARFDGPSTKQERKLILKMTMDHAIRQSFIKHELINISTGRDAVSVMRMFFINLSNNTLTYSVLPNYPTTIPHCWFRDFLGEVKLYPIGKPLKLVIYYIWQDILFEDEYSLIIKSRPICSMTLVKLNNYFPKAEIRALDRCKYRQPLEDQVFDEDVEAVEAEIRDYEQQDARSRLTSANFYGKFKLMLQIEDEHRSKQSLHFDQYNRIIYHMFGLRYFMEIDNEDMDTAVHEYKRLWVSPMAIRQTEVKMSEIRRNEQQANANHFRQRQVINKIGAERVERRERAYGSIVKVEDNRVYFELTQALEYFTHITRVPCDEESYFVRFVSDRSTITLQHQALDRLYADDISQIFFPTMDSINVGKWVRPDAVTINRKTAQWRTGHLNEEQKTAVENILKQQSYPHPYILFGPPGTGKTKTLVEAILQLIELSAPNKHILVCATSNSACDEIVQRLISNEMAKNNVFRLFAKSMEEEIADISADVLAVSNLKKTEHYYPSTDALSKYKVIVCTLTSSGRLTQGQIDPEFFSHIFVDEAGSATESQILISIAGLCSTKQQTHANLVLAGDPKQLGPLILSEKAADLGYGVSMLERLISTNPVYMKDQATDAFNTDYITQLVNNYRSHEAILHVPNKLFYDNTLRVCAPEENVNWFAQSDLLRKPNFPMLFHSVQGNAIRLRNESSPYNVAEIDLVIYYLRRLFNGEREIRQTDIGIISPYRRQCEEIAKRCKLSGLLNIQIGSVEKFQGQEKPIIIVSTVRSKKTNLGFLDNEKRLNVLLTRAKCLLIIIGDSNLLSTDHKWRQVVEYCKKNDSLIK